MTVLSIPNTFVALTTISSTEMNANFAAIVSAFQNSLGINGSETMTGQLKAANGAAAAPSVTFGADLDTGLYRKALNSLGFATAGTERAYIDADGFTHFLSRVDFATGADIASASTVDLTAATGNFVDITGTTTIATVTMNDGQQMLARFPGGLTLTNGASLACPGGTDATLAAGDFAVLARDDTVTRVILAPPSQVTGAEKAAATSQSLRAFSPKDVADVVSVSSGSGTGCVITLDADTDHDFNVTAGRWRSADDAVVIVLASEITKQGDATWAAGDDAGGMNDSDALGNNETFHIFLLSTADGVTTVDVGLDTDPDATNLLADTAVAAASLTKYRRIGSIKTDGSANIDSIDQIYGGPGVIQRIRVVDGEVSGGTGMIPNDDTIPQVSEGNEFLSSRITPTDATNLLRVTVEINLTTSVNNSRRCAALFRDGGSDAVAASQSFCPTADALNQAVLTYEVIAGSTSETTFTVRAGGQSAGTTRINGDSSGRLLGGVLQSHITIEEIAT